MFKNEGSVIFKDLNLDNYNASDKSETYERGCSYEVWGVESCINKYTVLEVKTTRYICAAIYSWSYDKIINVRSSKESCTASVLETKEKKHKHSNTLGIVSEKYTYNVYRKTYNHVFYDYGSDNDYSYCYPTYELYF